MNGWQSIWYALHQTNSRCFRPYMYKYMRIPRQYFDGGTPQKCGTWIRVGWKGGSQEAVGAGRESRGRGMVGEGVMGSSLSFLDGVIIRHLCDWGRSGKEIAGTP